MKDRVEQDELDYDTQQGQWKPSIFDHFEETFRDLEPESMKRPDGTYTGNPSLKGYQNGEKFGDNNEA